MNDFASTLAVWYARYGRELPWRDITDPYRIWISEIILQQTRVAQGYDYYLRFVRRFPTVETLAAATSDEVMQQWEGLGYYSRARNLHAAAQQIVAQGAFPRDYAGIRALKGVGDYTAAAIASFAFGQPTAVVDGNVYRVLSRRFGIDLPIDTTEGKKAFAALATELLDTHHPARHNQAIMDFGAVQCTPKRPQCLLCPFRDECEALASGRVDQLPIKSKRTEVTERHLVYLLIYDTDHRLLVHRRPAGDIWAGLYEPLLLEFPHTPSATDVLHHPTLAPLLAAGGTLTPVVEGMEHRLTHRLLRADAYRLTDAPSPILAQHPLLASFTPVDEATRAQLAFPRLVHRILEVNN